MGAGFDSRAYRFHKAYPEVHFFEIDLPATSADKQHRVEALGGARNPIQSPLCRSISILRRWMKCWERWVLPQINRRLRIGGSNLLYLLISDNYNTRGKIIIVVNTGSSIGAVQVSNGAVDTKIWGQTGSMGNRVWMLSPISQLVEIASVISQSVRQISIPIRFFLAP